MISCDFKYANSFNESFDLNKYDFIAYEVTKNDSDEKILARKELDSFKKICVNFDESFDLNRIETISNESKKKESDEKNIVKKELDSFKKTFIEIGKHALINLAFFGPYAFILHFLLAKYLIKR